MSTLFYVDTSFITDAQRESACFIERLRLIILGKFETIHPGGKLHDGLVDGFNAAADVQQFGMGLELLDDGVVHDPASAFGGMHIIIVPIAPKAVHPIYLYTDRLIPCHQPTGVTSNSSSWLMTQAFVLQCTQTSSSSLTPYSDSTAHRARFRDLHPGYFNP